MASMSCKHGWATPVFIHSLQAQTLKPIQIARVDFDAFVAARKEFTTEEWIDLLMQSIGFDPAAFGKRSDGKSAEAWAQQFIAQRTAPLDAGQSMADMAAKLVPQMVGPGSLPEGVRLAEQCMARVPAATYRRALDCIVTFDRQAALAHIGVPTLLVGGEFDRVASPAVMKQMAQQIPNARYTEMAGVGHLMNLEAPDEFDRILLDFLRQRPPRHRPDLH